MNKNNINKNNNLDFVQHSQSSEQKQQKRKREELDDDDCFGNDAHPHSDISHLKQKVKKQQIEAEEREERIEFLEEGRFKDKERIEFLEFKDALSKLHTDYKIDKNGIRKRFEEKLEFLYWYNHYDNIEVPKELIDEIRDIFKEIKQLYKRQPTGKKKDVLCCIANYLRRKIRRKED